jgi:hypothetical protein
VWASQLLPIRATSNITFDFSGTDNYNGVRKVEVVMFNCPEWRIGVDTIRLMDASSMENVKSTLSTFNTHNLHSCTSLVKTCMNIFTSRRVLEMQFHAGLDTDWIHLAEVTFYAGPSMCEPDVTISAMPQATPTLPAPPVATPTSNIEPSMTLIKDHHITINSE